MTYEAGFPQHHQRASGARLWNLPPPAAKVTPGKSRGSELARTVTWRAQAGCGLITQLGQDAWRKWPHLRTTAPWLSNHPCLGPPTGAQGMSKGKTLSSLMLRF